MFCDGVRRPPNKWVQKLSRVDTRHSGRALYPASCATRHASTFHAANRACERTHRAARASGGIERGALPVLFFPFASRRAPRSIALWARLEAPLHLLRDGVEGGSLRGSEAVEKGLGLRGEGIAGARAAAL